MFEQIAGLPLHPLAVHAPLTLVPLLALVATGYAVLPRLRPWLGWTVVALAFVAPASVWLARESGHAFRRRLAGLDQLPPELAGAVDEHATLSLTLVWLTVALAGAALALVVLVRLASGATNQAGGASARRGWIRIVALLLAVTVLGLSGATGWYVVRTGDTGARMVWQGS